MKNEPNANSSKADWRKWFCHSNSDAALVGNMSNPSQAGTSSNQAQQPTPDQLQQGGSSTSGSARHAEEEARKDRTLTEFMLMLDDYEPMVCCWTWFSATKSRCRCIHEPRYRMKSQTSTYNALGSSVRMYDCTYGLPMDVVPLNYWRPGNACCLLLHRNSSQTSLLMRINTLAYGQMQLQVAVDGVLEHHRPGSSFSQTLLPTL
jgi:hypothetical protein